MRSERGLIDNVAATPVRVLARMPGRPIEGLSVAGSDEGRDFVYVEPKGGTDVDDSPASVRGE